MNNEALPFQLTAEARCQVARDNWVVVGGRLWEMKMGRRKFKWLYFEF